MGLISYKNGQTSVVLRVKIYDSSSTTGAGLTGLTSASSGLRISTIADNESSATAYTVAGSTIEAVTTLGTYAAPTSTKCRFKEVDSTNHPGVYEIQLANARLAVSNAKSLLVTITGATNAAQCDAVIPLTSLDPYDSVRAGLTALPNAAAGGDDGLLILGQNTTTQAMVIENTGGSGIALNLINSVNNSQPALSIEGSTGNQTSGVAVDVIATDAITSAALATSAGTELAAAIWNALTSGLTTANSIGKKLADATFSTGSGTGARSVTPTVNDGSNPIEGATVRMTQGVNSYTTTTNASGVCSPAFSLDDATYTVTISKAGYSFTPTTLVVDGTKTPTYSMTAVTVSEPADPGLCRCYTYTKDRNGAIAGGVIVYYQIVSGPGTAGLSHPITQGSVTSNESTGKVEFDVYKGATIKIRRGGHDWSDDIPVGSGGTKALPELLGAP